MSLLQTLHYCSLVEGTCPASRERILVAALSHSATRQLQHYSEDQVDLFPPFHLGHAFQGLLEWTGACHMPSLLQAFIFLSLNGLSHLSSRPVPLSPHSKANTTNNHFFRALGLQGLTVEANIMVRKDDGSAPLGCAPHGDMDHSESCLNVMFLWREKKEPQCQVCCLHYREP